MNEHEQPGSIGFIVAPREATPEMKEAGFKVLAQAKDNRWSVEQTLPVLWRAMLAASVPKH